MEPSGALLEYYKYDLNGKPTFWSPPPLNTQLSTSNYGVRDLFSGERYITELGMYDLRNRFYSPELGRFLQPDPIGFKGDGSNLYRYCGNDWANKTDPMGLQSGYQSSSYSFWFGKGSWETLRGLITQLFEQPAGNTTTSPTNTISAENEGPKEADKSQKSSTPSPANRVVRTVNTSFSRRGKMTGNYLTTIRFKHTVNLGGKPVGRGVRVGENVSFEDGIDVGPKGQNQEWRTNSQGQVFDDYQIPFYNERGSVRIVQQLTVDGKLQGQWETIVRGNGSFNMRSEVETERAGDTMILR